MKLWLPFFLLLAAPAAASDWMQFRGPNASGIGEEAPLPVEFGPQKNLVWRTPLPQGHSSPILVGDRIFVTAVEGESLLTIALERDSGKELWRREAPRSRVSETHNVNNAAAPSAVSDGENVYVFFGDYGLLSYTHAGDERWRLPLGPFNNGMGMSASPILADGKLVMICDQDIGSYMFAADPRNGELLWKTDRAEYTRGFSTPTLYRPAAGETELIVPGSYELAGYSLDSGKKLWWVRGLAWQLKSVAIVERDHVYVHGWAAGGDQPPSETELPTWAQVLSEHDANGDGKITKPEAFLDKMRKNFDSFDIDNDGALNERDWQFSRARDESRNSLMAVKLGGRGDVTDTHVSWSLRKNLPNVPSPLLYRDVIFLVKDGGIFSSVDAATGEPLKQGRLRDALGKYFSSPVGGDGKVYVIDENGMATVISANAEWEILAANDLGEAVNATPAIAGGRLYLRTHAALYCFAAEQ